MLNKLYFKGMAAMGKIKSMMTKENGEANIVAIILVIAIVVALAILFRESIASLFQRIWGSITGNVGTVTDPNL